MEGTTKLIENESSLEKSAIRDMIRNDDNKSKKGRFKEHYPKIYE